MIQIAYQDGKQVLLKLPTSGVEVLVLNLELLVSEEGQFEVRVSESGLVRVTLLLTPPYRFLGQVVYHNLKDSFSGNTLSQSAVL